MKLTMSHMALRGLARQSDGAGRGHRACRGRKHGHCAHPPRSRPSCSPAGARPIYIYMPRTCSTYVRAVSTCRARAPHAGLPISTANQASGLLFYARAALCRCAVSARAQNHTRATPSSCEQPASHPTAPIEHRQRAPQPHAHAWRRQPTAARRRAQSRPPQAQRRRPPRDFLTLGDLVVFLRPRLRLLPPPSS